MNQAINYCISLLYVGTDFFLVLSPNKEYAVRRLFRFCKSKFLWRLMGLKILVSIKKIYI